MPIKLDLHFYAGDDLRRPAVLRFKDADDAPVDVSSWSWEALWRVRASAEESIALDVDLTDATDGIVRVRASAAVTREVSGSGVWDLQETHDGVTTTWAGGKALWTEDVTRD